MKLTTKQWIILAVVVLVIVLIIWGVKVYLDNQAEAQKQLLYQSQLSNLSNIQPKKPPFLDQVLGVFTKLLVL